MMDVKEFQHFFPTWEIYPRVFYFFKRYVDLYSRFKTVIDAIPTRLHSAASLCHADKLSRCFGKFLNVTVIGEEDIAPADFIVSSKPLETIAYLPVSSDTENIHICICHSYIGDIGRSGIEAIRYRINYFAKNVYQRSRGLCFPLIVCETREDYPDDDKGTLHLNIRKEIDSIPELRQHPFHILIGPNKENLKDEVSKVLENEVTAGFQKILFDLQRFMRKDLRNDKEQIIILESEPVVKEIRGFLRNRKGLIDTKCLGATKHDSFIDLVLENLSHKIMCAAVAPMAMKYSLPDAVCYDLLDEIHFDKHLNASVTKNTKYHLQKLEKNLLEKSAEEKSKIDTKFSFDHSFDYILYMLQTDMKMTVESTERKFRSMEKITTVMRKMIFEINGYLRQAGIAIKEDGIGVKELSNTDITPELREDILRTKGVYGMGTLYGRLEIHLANDMSEEKAREAREHLTDVMKKRQFHHSYVVRTVDENAKPLAIYEQGDKLISRFPNNVKENREGTLGCFVVDKSQRLFCLTCAHVVDPHQKPSHVVLVCKEQSPKRFGLSTRERTIVTGAQDLALIDFAAVTIHDNVKPSCNCCIRDEDGNTKPAEIATELKAESVGSRVYKRGAKTGLTSGIIASNDYFFSSENAKEHILIVEPLPLLSNEDTFVDKRSDTPPNSPKARVDLFADHAQINTTNFALNTDSNTNEVQMNDQSEEKRYDGNTTGDAEGPAYLREGNDVLLRPEMQDASGHHDDKSVDMRSLNEYSSDTGSDYSDTATNIFADQGDSGSVVCMDDIVNNCIVVLSMISAGHYKLNVPGSESSDTAKCFSFMLHKALVELGEKCGTSFSLV